jgi:hypothetical protein
MSGTSKNCGALTHSHIEFAALNDVPKTTPSNKVELIGSPQNHDLIYHKVDSYPLTYPDDWSDEAKRGKVVEIRVNHMDRNIIVNGGAREKILGHFYNSHKNKTFSVCIDGRCYNVDACVSNGQMIFLNKVFTGKSGVYELRLKTKSEYHHGCPPILNVNGDGGGHEVKLPGEVCAFPSSNKIGFLMNSGDGCLSWNNNLFLNINTSVCPSSSISPGTAGSMCADSKYLYVCVATNTWKRIVLNAWL